MRQGGVKLAECIAFGGKGLHAHKGGILGFVCLKVQPAYTRSAQFLPLWSNVQHNPCSKMQERGLVHSRHDEIRNLEAALLSKVCRDVMIEPSLQPLTGETFPFLSTITDDGARLDVKTRGFYRPGQ